MNRCGPPWFDFPPIDPMEMEHATCLMDEQLHLIAEYFLAIGIGQSGVSAIKDASLNYLQAMANNDNGNNPDLINWFGYSGMLTDLYNQLDDMFISMYNTPIPGSELEDVIEIYHHAHEPIFMTLLTQLKLMADIGDPSNMDQLDKDQFKSIDWNSVIPPGTTYSSLDAAAIFSAAETAIINAGGTVPSGLEDSISRMADDAQSDIFNPQSTAAPSTTPTQSNTPTSPISTAPTPVSPTISSSSTRPLTFAPPTATTTSNFILDQEFSPLPVIVTTASSIITAQTTDMNGSGSGNSNGFGNGLGSMFGDPHIRIKNPNEPAICFDIEGQSFLKSKVFPEFHFRNAYGYFQYFNRL